MRALQRWSGGVSKASCVAAAMIAVCLAGGAQRSALAQTDVVESGRDRMQAMSQESLDGFVSAMESILDDDLLSVVEVLVVERGDTVLHTTIKRKEQSWNGHWQPNGLCNLRSMTSVFTGAAIQILVDRGELDLDDRVAQYLPAFDTDELRLTTIDHLLTHKSGLTLSAIVSGETYHRFTSLRNMVDSMAGRKTVFPPGAASQYSLVGIDVLARVIEVVGARTIDEFLEAELFKPLGMNDTFFSFNAKDPRFQQDEPPMEVSQWSQLRVFSNDGSLLYPFALGSLAAYGSVGDCATFLAMLKDGGVSADGTRILSEDAVARMSGKQSVPRLLLRDDLRPTGFRGVEPWSGRLLTGLWPIDSPNDSAPSMIGHIGWDGTMAWAMPDRDVMILCFTPSWRFGSDVRIEYAIDRWLLHPDGNDEEQQLPDRLKDCLGTYINMYQLASGEECVVSSARGRLQVQFGARDPFELLEPTADGRMSFAAYPTNGAVSFERDENGVVIAMQAHSDAQEAVSYPREGSALHLAKKAEQGINLDDVQFAIGTYASESTDKAARVYVKGSRLYFRDYPDQVVHELVGTSDPHVFRFRNRAYVSVRFAVGDNGVAESASVEIRNEGVRWVMKRRNEEATKR